MSVSNSKGPIARQLERLFHTDLYCWLAAFALFSCAFVIGCDVVMWLLLDDYNPVRDTISKAAAGPYSEIQDAGIVVFAAGILALTAGLVLRGRGDRMSWLVRTALMLLAADIMLLALWNDYGDGHPGGIVIHNYLVVVMGVLVPIILWLIPSVPPIGRSTLSRGAKALAVIWAIAAPFLPLVPQAVIGLYERTLFMIMVASVAAAGWRLYQRADDGFASR